MGMPKTDYRENKYKAQKKPVVFEAMQVPLFPKDPVAIETPNGEITANPLDWVFMDENGCYRVMSPDEFKEEYELLERGLTSKSPEELLEQLQDFLSHVGLSSASCSDAAWDMRSHPNDPYYQYFKKRGEIWDKLYDLLSSCVRKTEELLDDIGAITKPEGDEKNK